MTTSNDVIAPRAPLATLGACSTARNYRELLDCAVSAGDEVEVKRLLGPPIEEGQFPLGHIIRLAATAAKYGRGEMIVSLLSDPRCARSQLAECSVEAALSSANHAMLHQLLSNPVVGEQCDWRQLIVRALANDDVVVLLIVLEALSAHRKRKPVGSADPLPTRFLKECLEYTLESDNAALTKLLYDYMDGRV